MELIDSLMQQRYEAFEDAKSLIYDEGSKASLKDDCPYEEGSWEAEAWHYGRNDAILD